MSGQSSHDLMGSGAIGQQKKSNVALSLNEIFKGTEDTTFYQGKDVHILNDHGETLHGSNVNFKGAVSMDEIGYNASPGAAVKAMGNDLQVGGNTVAG